jgi:hypothetical protein
VYRPIRGWKPKALLTELTGPIKSLEFFFFLSINATFDLVMRLSNDSIVMTIGILGETIPACINYTVVAQAFVLKKLKKRTFSYPDISLHLDCS